MTEDHELIASARRRLGLTQAQLADILGVTVQTVKRWEMNPLTCPSHRRAPETILRVIGWMLEKGRPKTWPKGVE